MLLGYVVLLGRVGLQIEEHHGLGRVAGKHIGVVVGRGLLVGGEDGHAVRAAWIDPVALEVLGPLGRCLDVQLPSAAPHGHQVWAAHDAVVGHVDPGQLEHCGKEVGAGGVG